jgi:hypothetical protein
MIKDLFNSNVQFLVVNKNEKGFTIVLKDKAPQDINFSWIALAVKSAKTWSSKTDTTITPLATDPTNIPLVATPPQTTGDTTTTPATPVPTPVDTTVPPVTPPSTTPAPTTTTADVPPVVVVPPTDNTTPPVTPPADTNSPATTTPPVGDSAPVVAP